MMTEDEDKPDVVIERDIPVPIRKKRGKHGSRTWGRILQTMQIGESFLYPATTSIRSNLHNAAKRVSVEISVRENIDARTGMPDGNVRVHKVGGKVFTPSELTRMQKQVLVNKRGKRRKKAEMLDHIASCDNELCYGDDHKLFREQK